MLPDHARSAKAIRNSPGSSPTTRRTQATALSARPPGRLDPAFAAVADPTRRGILQRLAQGDTSISDLAETFGMTLTGIRKHVHVLEGRGS